MPYWVQVDTEDNNKVLANAPFANPADRAMFNDGTLVCRPDDNTGLAGRPPDDLFVESGDPLATTKTPNYRWNGTALEAL